jgi:oligoendopeptidase F
MYYNFYVYKYSTSYAASMAIEEHIMKQGKPAVDSYMRFLKAGSSEYPAELLKEAGVDLTTPEPFTTALAKFDHIVTEIEKTYNEISKK